MLIQRETYNNQYITQLHSNVPGNPSDYFVEFEDIGVGLLKVTWETGGTEIELNAILDAHNSLAVDSDKLTIIADLVDEAIITCGALVNFDYVVYIPDGSKLSGSTTDGSLEFSTDTVGVHIVEIKEPGTYNTGYVEIEGTQP